MDTLNLRQSATDAIRYWEPRRLVYNAVLAAIVLINFAIRYPQSKSALNFEAAQMLFVLAVIANAAYCAAYAVDVFAQTSGFADVWRKYRWVLFAIGLVFAGILARFVSSGLLSGRA
jgi:hypothetical protein